MNLSRIKSFRINGEHITPCQVKDFGTWPRLKELVPLLEAHDHCATVTNTRSGYNLQDVPCMIIYTDKLIFDTDQYVELGFCPVHSKTSM